MAQEDGPPPSIGAAGALSIGIGGIVGGGFFATFGVTIAGARGATPLAFVFAGLIALLTAYSYIGLTLRYPGAGGTVTFIRTAYGSGLLAAGLNVLLVLSYIAVMSVYASALASYAAANLPEASRASVGHIIASMAVILLGLVNFAGASLMRRVETLFNAGKLVILGLFIILGFLLGRLDWSRLEPAAWPPPLTIVSSGMLGFLAYEGFELIANASGNIRNPRRTLPIAFLGSVLIAIVIYALAFVVAIGHLSFAEIAAARNFAVSAAAGAVLGPFGFALLTVGAILASASAINADYFGASKLPVMLADQAELPSVFHRTIYGKSLVSLVTIGALALMAVNLLGLHALSAATSGGFLIVFAAVNLAASRLAPETGGRAWVSALAGVLCVVALAVMVADFLASPETRASGIAVGAIVVVALAIEAGYRLATPKPAPAV